MHICQCYPQDVIRKAKFVFAFENSASKDYVTEKYFHSLEVGAIPVVYRTPNIKDFEPAPNSIIATDDYQYVCPRIGVFLHFFKDSVFFTCFKTLELLTLFQDCAFLTCFRTMLLFNLCGAGHRRSWASTCCGWRATRPS
jgi:hypothetical protein